MWNGENKSKRLPRYSVGDPKGCIAWLLATVLGSASLFIVSNAQAQDRSNLSIEDMIAGFEGNVLSYYEILFVNGKYARAFNECLKSKPADYDWIRANCPKSSPRCAA